MYRAIGGASRSNLHVADLARAAIIGRCSNFFLEHFSRNSANEEGDLRDDLMIK